MSSRREGRGGRNPKDMPREQQVSKKVSWLLRHGASQEGLTLGKGGYVNVADALNTRALRSLKVTFPELRQIVATNDKQRFSLIPTSAPPQLLESEAPQVPPPLSDTNAFDPIPESEDPADYRIRANQGHSLKVEEDGLLTRMSEEMGNLPGMVVHGTDERAWQLILKSGGLRKMGRNHIHFASGLPAGFRSVLATAADVEAERAAPPVISGMRKSSTVLIFLDVKKALDAGIKFWISENGVVLSEGNDEGLVPCEFFQRVESRTKGGAVLMQDGVVPEGTVVDLKAWEQEVGGVNGKGKRGGKRGGRGRGGGKPRVTDDQRGIFAGLSVHSGP